jgi:SagB-type dehydrogenase family enzyme
MKRFIGVLVTAAMMAAPIGAALAATAPPAAPQEIVLPAPDTTGGMSLNEALSRRRSVRGFEAKPLTQAQLGQLLWAAQGITEPDTGHRTAPSAMATYPLTLYVCTADGVFTYQPNGHKLLRLSAQDRRADVTQSPRGGQSAPVSIVFTGEPGKFGTRFPDRAAAFVYLEVGHAAENLALEATALGLATVTQGGIDAAKISHALNLPEGTLIVYTMPVGYPAASK